MNKFKVGDKVRYLLKDDYPGGAVIKKQSFSTNRTILTISEVLHGSFYMQCSNSSSQWTADNYCVVRAIKPIILICRKIKYRED